MENDDTTNNQQETSSDSSPTALKKQTRKERSKADATSQKTQQDKKKSYRRSWRSASPLKKLEIIILGIGSMVGISYLGVLIWQTLQTKWIFQDEHRGRVVLSRPPELLGPVESDIEHRIILLPAVRLWFKASGEVKRAYAIPFLATLVPDKPTGNHGIDNPFPIVTDAICRLGHMGYYGFPINAGQEIAMDISSSSQNLPIDFDATGKPKLSAGWENVTNDAAVRLYIPGCAFYTDEYDVDHAVCDTYQFIPDGYTSSFPSGQKINGRFMLSALGSCAD
jgi:hypothetical protein